MDGAKRHKPRVASKNRLHKVALVAAAAAVAAAGAIDAGKPRHHRRPKPKMGSAHKKAPKKPSSHKKKKSSHKKKKSAGRPRSHKRR